MFHVGRSLSRHCFDLAILTFPTLYRHLLSDFYSCEVDSTRHETCVAYWSIRTEWHETSELHSCQWTSHFVLSAPNRFLLSACAQSVLLPSIRLLFVSLLTRRLHFVTYMAHLILSLVLLLFTGTPADAFLFGRNRALSPTSNVHVDVINHINSALETHSTEFHHSRRDYLFIGLLLILLIFCGYRRLITTFVPRRAPPSSDTGLQSVTTAKYWTPHSSHIHLIARVLSCFLSLASSLALIRLYPALVIHERGRFMLMRLSI